MHCEKLKFPQVWMAESCSLSMVETGILPGSGSFPYKKHRNTYLLLKTLPQIKIVGTSLKT